MVYERNYEQIGKNTHELVEATEWFHTLMYFLHEERKTTKLRFKIGTFNYDNEWIDDIICVLQEDKEGLADIFFQTIRYGWNITEEKTTMWGHITRLTDLCYGWEFERSEVNINWNIINDFRKLLNNKENDIFISYYDEIHSDFW